MKRLAIAVAILGILCLPGGAAQPVLKKAGGQADEKGVFRATLTAGDQTNEFESPSKAMSMLRRIASKLRRAKDSEMEFKAVINVNGGLHEFTKPADALTALRAVTAAMLRARKARIGFGEIGKIEVAEGALSKEELKKLQEKTEEERKKALLERQMQLRAQQMVRMRIMQALANEMQRSRGRPPDPFRLQQIIQQEVDKARKGGLISGNTGAFNFSANPAEFAKQAELEKIRQALAKAFAKASQNADDAEKKTGEKAETKDKAEEKAEKKTEEKTEEKPEEKAEGKPKKAEE